MKEIGWVCFFCKKQLTLTNKDKSCDSCGKQIEFSHIWIQPFMEDNADVTDYICSYSKARGENEGTI